MFDNQRMQKVSKAEREARRKIASDGGKALAKKLSPKQLKAAGESRRYRQRQSTKKESW